MAEFTKKLKKDGTYHAPGRGNSYELRNYSEAVLSELATDPACIERAQCSDELERRLKFKREEEERDAKRQLAEEQRLEQKRNLLSVNPFDPRIEVSADAKHIAGRIVTALWLTFVLIPFVLGLLYELLK